jgi:hypothetical protein
MKALSSRFPVPDNFPFEAYPLRILQVWSHAPLSKHDTSMDSLEQLVSKTREASINGIAALSHGESLAAALVLNRADWLASLGYTIPEALERIGPEWVAMIPMAAKVVASTNSVLANAERSARDEEFLASHTADVMDLSATLVTYGDSPGYRTAHFLFEVTRFGGGLKRLVRFNVEPKDGERIARHLIDVHRLAWDQREPLDVQPGEQRPGWID